MSWGQPNNPAPQPSESSAAPVPAPLENPATSVASAAAFDESSDVIARSVSVREMAAKFDANVAQPALSTHPVLTVTASVVHHNSPDQLLPHAHFSAVQEYESDSAPHVVPADATQDVLSSNQPAQPAPTQSLNHNHVEFSQPDETKRLSSSETIIGEVMDADPLMATFTPPEVEISPPPFSYSDIHNVDPRGLTFCYLVAEYCNGTIKRRVLKIDCSSHSVSLHKLAGKDAIWSYHFSQLKEVEGSQDNVEWDETLPTDSVFLVPHTGSNVPVLLCYPVDSISLRLSLNSELDAFRASNNDANAPARSSHGLRCLLHEGKAYAGTSTRPWNSRIVSIYCGRVYLLNSFSDTIPCDIIDLLGCRVESSSQAPCQLVLHAAIRYTFTFSSPKVRDVFVNALKQAKTMYETCVTQYSEYCRGMRMLSKQNLLYAMDVKRTIFREQLRLANVKTARDSSKTSSPTLHASSDSSAPQKESNWSQVEVVPIIDAPVAHSGGLASSHASEYSQLNRAVAHASEYSQLNRAVAHASEYSQMNRAVGPEACDQVSNLPTSRSADSNMSTARSAAEHEISLRLAQKYQTLRAAEFGAPRPQSRHVQAPVAVSLADILREDDVLPPTFMPNFSSTHVNSQSNFAEILPHLYVAVAPISLDVLVADIQKTHGQSSKLYLFDADDAASIRRELPVAHDTSFVFDKDHPPSLASICMYVSGFLNVFCRDFESDASVQVCCRCCCLYGPKPQQFRCVALFRRLSSLLHHGQCPAFAAWGLLAADE
jgi:outer membrane lipopolysaccharide assembly protein LptE/RlpB